MNIKMALSKERSPTPGKNEFMWWPWCLSSLSSVWSFCVFEDKNTKNDVFVTELEELLWTSHKQGLKLRRRLSPYWMPQDIKTLFQTWLQVVQFSTAVSHCICTDISCPWNVCWINICWRHVVWWWQRHYFKLLTNQHLSFLSQAHTICSLVTHILLAFNFDKI